MQRNLLYKDWVKNVKFTTNQLNEETQVFSNYGAIPQILYMAVNNSSQRNGLD